MENKDAVYPDFPYHPAKQYPEFQFDEFLEQNLVYNSIREAFHLLGLDENNFGSKNWNPLGSIIKLNDSVVIKPNFVEWKDNDLDFYTVTTHCSVIRTMIDYTLIALKNTGKIIVAEAVQNSTIYERIIKRNRVLDLISFYKSKGINNIEFRDVRNIRGDKRDPEGYTIENLGNNSLYATWPKKKLRRLYGADYNRKETIKAHTRGNNIYELANTFLNADVLITIPKLKTHTKAGVSFCLKSFIGMMGNKNLVPHRSISSPKRNGDSYPATHKLRVRLYLRLVQFYKDIFMTKGLKRIYSFCRKTTKIVLQVKQKHLVVTQGKWSGNNTLWPAIVDISNIWLKKDIRFFAVIDGILAGDKDGPIFPRPRKEGIVIVGDDYLITDIASTYLIGIDPMKVKYLQYYIKNNKIDYNSIEIKSNVNKYHTLFNLSREDTLKFEPTDAWATIKLSD